ncbi:hypothetical protein BJH93_06975 [Kocuria polaris]|nr:hypothetical protein [Kocuria polaris]
MLPETATSAALSRRSLIRAGLLGAAGLAAAPALSACGNGASDGGSLVWSSWTNPGEAAKHKAFSAELGEKLGLDTKFQAITGDYQQKLLAQLAGGAAPDAFYVGEAEMAKLIESEQVIDLSEYLASADSPIKQEDFHENLLGWTRPEVGSPEIYGLPVDCNPAALWFNKDVLAEAGVDVNPAQQFEAGTWTPDALEDVLSQVKAAGKRGLASGSWWFDWYGWMTIYGGTPFDDAGKAVFDTDAKCLQGLEWMFEQFGTGNMTFSGALPQGQGADALFFSGQMAFLNMGRWVLPNLMDLNFGFDVAPHPSPSGKDFMSVPLGAAAIAVNAKARNPEGALEFVANYVSPDGQRARLSGGGNAVPSIAGLDDVVTEDGIPEHAHFFNEIAAHATTLPLTVTANAKVASEYGNVADKLLKDDSTTAKSFATALAKFINSGGEA